MGRSQHEEELAVECGYWHLWRYNPLLADEGKNPFTLDSKAPNWANFRDFLLGEVRYLSVQKAFPKEADELFSQAEKMAKLRYQTYVRKSQEDWSEQIYSSEISIGLIYHLRRPWLRSAIKVFFV